MAPFAIFILIFMASSRIAQAQAQPKLPQIITSTVKSTAIEPKLPLPAPLIINNSSSQVNLHPFNYTIVEENICKNDTFLLIIVHSSPENFKRREFIRNTYGNRRLYSQLKMVVVFMMGAVPPTNLKGYKIQMMIEREHEMYHDIVQENFIDTYRNLTYKAIGWMKWTTQYCQQPPFVLKVDDDVLVNPYVLVRHLAHMQKNNYATQNTISCLRWDKVKVIRNKTSKWYVSEAEYAGTVYPPYCSGSAWIFSMDLVPRLLEASYSQPFFWIDDFYITGSLARAVGAHFNQMKSLFRGDNHRRDRCFFKNQNNHLNEKTGEVKLLMGKISCDD